MGTKLDHDYDPNRLFLFASTPAGAMQAPRHLTTSAKASTFRDCTLRFCTAAAHRRSLSTNDCALHIHLRLPQCTGILRRLSSRRPLAQVFRQSTAQWDSTSAFPPPVSLRCRATLDHHYLRYQLPSHQVGFFVKYPARTKRPNPFFLVMHLRFQGPAGGRPEWTLPMVSTNSSAAGTPGSKSPRASSLTRRSRSFTTNA